MITRDEAVERYGAIENGIWRNANLWCETLVIPDDIAFGWINSATYKPTKHIYCNKDMAPALLRALQRVRQKQLLSQLRTFDGCFEVRDVRGVPGQWSWHSFGCAIDINAATNKLGTVGDNSSALIACFVEEGFQTGASFTRLDPMHQQYGLD